MSDDLEKQAQAEVNLMAAIAAALRADIEPDRIIEIIDEVEQSPDDC